MRTIGRHLPRGRHQRQIRCDLCGVHWYEKDMVYDRAEGWWRCPDDRSGHGPSALSEMNARAAEMTATRPGNEGPLGGGYESSPNAQNAASFDYSTAVDLRVYMDPANAELYADGTVNTIACSGSVGGSFDGTVTGASLRYPYFAAKDDTFNKSAALRMSRTQGTRLVYNGDAPWKAGESPYIFVVAKLDEFPAVVSGANPYPSSICFLLEEVTSGYVGTLDITSTTNDPTYYPYTANVPGDYQVWRQPRGDFSPVLADDGLHVFEVNINKGFMLVDGEVMPMFLAPLNEKDGDVTYVYRQGVDRPYGGFTGMYLGGSGSANNVSSWSGRIGKLLLANDVDESSAAVVRAKLMEQYNITRNTESMYDRTVRAIPGVAQYYTGDYVPL